MSLSKRTTTLAAATRSEKDEGGLRPVHRTSIGSTSAGTKGKSGRGSTTKK